jgi:hypothetical protein
MAGFSSIVRSRIQLDITEDLEFHSGARSYAVGGGTALQAGRLRVRSPIKSLEFFSDLILPVA